jgi:hypothetical protein
MVSLQGMHGKGIGLAGRPVALAVPCPREPMDQAAIQDTRPAETESAPIRYVADLLGSERAIRWLIALMVLCCDAPAIALTAPASARRSEAQRDEQSEVETVHSIR